MESAWQHHPGCRAAGSRARYHLRVVRCSPIHALLLLLLCPLASGQERIDVRAHGATGDGVTDDAPAIQRALDAAAGGGTVVLPPSDRPYLVGRTLTVHGDGIRADPLASQPGNNRCRPQIPDQARPGPVAAQPA